MLAGSNMENIERRLSQASTCYKECMSLTGCGDLDIGDLDLYRFWRQLSQNLTNLDKIKTNKDK